MAPRTIFLRGVGGVEVVDPDGREGRGGSSKDVLLDTIEGNGRDVVQGSPHQATAAATPRIHLMVPADLPGVHECTKHA